MAQYIAARFPRRFTLRLLLAGITLLCIGLGIWTHRAREQKALRDLLDKGGHVSIICLSDGDESLTASIRRAVERLVGRNELKDIEGVIAVDSALIEKLDRFPCLRQVGLDATKVTDDDLQHLTKLKNVEWVHVTCIGETSSTARPTECRLGDKSLYTIGRMPSIKHFTIEGFGFTADGIRALTNAHTLEEVRIRWCSGDVSADDLEPLRALSKLKRGRILRWTSERGEETVAEW